MFNYTWQVSIIFYNKRYHMLFVGVGLILLRGGVCTAMKRIYICR